MQFRYHIHAFFRPPSDVPIDPEVRKHYKRNFIANTLDNAIWYVGDSFVSVTTILPVFASKMTDSAVMIGLVTALVNAGWFIPQFFLAGYVKNLKKKLPFAKKMAILERLPAMILPVTAILLHWIPDRIVIWIFMIVIAMRGFSSGMVALPWQEVIAMVIPSSMRSRFFGIARMLGTIGAVIGSTVSGIILSAVAYPNNYALSFIIGAIFIWISFFFFCRNIEPEINPEKEENVPNKPLVDLKAYKNILNTDKNFRIYIFSRIFFQLGTMSAGFMAVYGIQHFSLTDEYAAIFSGLLFTSSILGNLIWSFLGDKIGPRNTLLFSTILQAFVLVLSLVAESIWVYYLVFLVYGIAQSGFIIGDLILGMELGSEEDRPLYLGLARSIPGVFVLLAPIIGGVLVEWTGYWTMFLTSLVLFTISIVLILRVCEFKQLNIT